MVKTFLKDDESLELQKMQKKIQFPHQLRRHSFEWVLYIHIEFALFHIWFYSNFFLFDNKYN
jgi:hypothetical protein